MQRFGRCELCGRVSLTADYGFHNEYICVPCSMDGGPLEKHVTDEMIRRHGREKLQDWTAGALGIKTRH